MTDIATRLHEAAMEAMLDGGELYAEAVDEIERLRALSHIGHTTVPTCVEAAAKIALLQATRNKDQDEITRLRMENAALRRALEPKP